MFLHLIRALFPRWNFFDRAADDLSFEINDRGAADWRRVSFTQSRPPFGLFINADVNLALAQHSLLEHFIQDLQSGPPEVEQLTSYKMILAIAELHARDGEFQFKIAARRAGKILAMYVSTWLPTRAR